MRLLSILIPVYNEEKLLAEIVARVLAAPLPEGLERELVLVDDCSTDRSPEVIAELCAAHGEIRAFRQETNQGKGAAIRRAIREMRGDFAIIQDADLEYDPEEYPIVLEPLLDGEADAVYGSRFALKRKWSDIFSLHKTANRFLTTLSNLTSGFRLTDMETCYKAFRGDLVRSIPLRSNRFGIEPEITIKLAQRGAVVCEVPISYHGRLHSEGKKIGWKDGISAIWTILKYWLRDDSRETGDGGKRLRRGAWTDDSNGSTDGESPENAENSGVSQDKSGGDMKDSSAFRRRNGCLCRPRRPGRGI